MKNTVKKIVSEDVEKAVGTKAEANTNCFMKSVRNSVEKALHLKELEQFSDDQDIDFPTCITVNGEEVDDTHIYNAGVIKKAILAGERAYRCPGYDYPVLTEEEIGTRVAFLESIIWSKKLD